MATRILEQLAANAVTENRFDDASYFFFKLSMEALKVGCASASCVCVCACVCVHLRVCMCVCMWGECGCAFGLCVCIWGGAHVCFSGS
jgi:hypothetical protein